MKRIIHIFLLVLFVSIALNAKNFEIIPRYNYFLSNQTGEIIIKVSDDFDKGNYKLFCDDKLVKDGKITHPKTIINFDLNLISNGENYLKMCFDDSTEFHQILVNKFAEKDNSVQINNLSKSLEVDGKPFFPFGFYAYWPLQESLPEQEVVNGFNMISPYHKILKDEISKRKAYLDRCADLGIKVNYNLCSLVGGGGVGTSRLNLPDDKLDELLRKEVETFKDHPAILSWYIADEPVLNGTKPELLESKYNLIKSIDKYHPISIVFMRPAKSAKYSKCLDIAMADPYPIPDHPITLVSDRVQQLKKNLPDKIIWVVPQAFGGSEWWKREPTRQEIRNMTYQAIISGATGIKYFVRNGLNSFPKSTATWAECGAVAVEIAEIAPQILSSEISPKIECKQEDIQTKAWQAEGIISVLVVNNLNEPREIDLKFPDMAINCRVKILSENRDIEMVDGELHDIIDSYGTKIYQIEYQQLPSFLEEENIAYNGDFERSFSPGIVAGFYASPRKEFGVTYFSDPFEKFSGRHSMKINNPTANEGLRLRTYPVKLQPDQNYILSIYAKSDKEFYIETRDLNFWQKLFGAKEKVIQPNTFRIACDGNNKIFELTKDWKEYSFDISAKSASRRKVISLEFLGKGKVWFDLLQVVPSIKINSSLKDDKLYVEIDSAISNDKIVYAIDEDLTLENAKAYSQPFIIEKTSLITAGRLVNGKIKNITKEKIQSHKAIGKKVDYLHSYKKKYSASGEFGLVDGVFGSDDYLDGRWQGFIYNDLDVIIDLEKSQKIENISINFLQNHQSWIFLPKEVIFSISDDGENFIAFSKEKLKLSKTYEGKKIVNISKKVNVKGRYVRVIAKNIKECPNWHRGKGKPAWLFADEISID